MPVLCVVQFMIETCYLITYKLAGTGGTSLSWRHMSYQTNMKSVFSLFPCLLYLSLLICIPQSRYFLSYYEWLEELLLCYVIQQ